MGGYYAERLAGERLRRCYELAPPRIRQYLKSEIQHVASRLEPTDNVLELGCGYGRVALELAERVAQVVGIDTSEESLALARAIGAGSPSCSFLLMDACSTTFADGVFDAVVCVQNGICAFGRPPGLLLRESLRVTRGGGRILFSTYSDKVWEHRLEWFEAQARAGLLGEIDEELTGDGVIVCKDGFRAGLMNQEGFTSLCSEAGVECKVVEVDESSLFCEIERPDFR